MTTETKQISKAQQKATNKYIKNNYDRVNLMLPLGYKDKIRKYVELSGYTDANGNKESTNAFIRRAIDNLIESDNTLNK